MRIRIDQLAQFHEAAERNVLQQFTNAVIQEIYEVDSSLVVSYPAEHLQMIVQDALNAALRYDIRDFDDLCVWACLRLVSQYQFWDNPGLRYFLDEPLLHPKAKVQNLVRSYKLAAFARHKEK